MRNSLLTDTVQAPANIPPQEASGGDSNPETTFPPPPADKEWGNTHKQEWSEHSAAAWALAHVIHRIRSTPLPPILLPEQRRHFQQVIQMAAALMEEWQRRERDQAQQLATTRPPPMPLMEASGMSEGHLRDTNLLDKSPNGSVSIEAEVSLGRHLASDHLHENQEKDIANQNDPGIE